MTFDWFYGEKNNGGRRLCFDIETNGLLPDVDKLWSLCIADVDTKESWSFSDSDPLLYQPLEVGLEMLSKASVVFGHNIIGYDIPVLKHLYPGFELEGIARDTLTLAKMIWPMEVLKLKDFPRWRAGKLPGNLIGAHKLEAWGYRLGEQKGEYAKDVLDWGRKLRKEECLLSAVPEAFQCLLVDNAEGYIDYGQSKTALDPWKAWNKPMQDYCEVDVAVTLKLLELIEGHLDGTGSAAKGIGWSPESVKLEHDILTICLDQERRGYGFDLEGARKMAAELNNRQAELVEELKEAFGSWWEPMSDPKTGEVPAIDRKVSLTEFPDVTITRVSEKTGKELKPYVGPPKAHYYTDAPFVKVQWTTFDPGSRAQLGKRLQDVYGWKPVEFGGAKGDQAKVDETTIKNIPDGVVPQKLKETILEFYVIQKTLGQLANGSKAWIELCGTDGRLHGRVDPLGTISHRGAHSIPNLGQVPSVSVNEIKDEATGEVVKKELISGWRGGFGVECRSLFRPGVVDFKQTGTDASGLELRLLGHYLYKHDDGAFARMVSTPGLDIHAENAKITGLSRAETKTVTYAFLYGAGNLKIGIGVGVKDEEVADLVNSKAAKSYLRWLHKVKLPTPDEMTLATVMKGKIVKDKFLSGITGLKELQAELKAEAEEFGFIKALDGRKLSIRKAHAVLNQALQGGGAIVCKVWNVEMLRILREDYHLVDDVDFGQMAWVHDELQFEHREGLEDVVAEASEKAMVRAAEILNFQGKLTTDSKSGYNWKDCH